MKTYTYINESVTDSGIVLEQGIFTVWVYSNLSPMKDTVNEDSAAVFFLNERHMLAIVADGMGGTAAGDKASRIVIETLQRHLEAEQNVGEACIIAALEQANREIMALGVSAGSTAAVVEINNNKVQTYHVGDSEIMLVGQRGKLKYQTVSHSPVAYAMQAGQINEMQAMWHAERHIISNAVGFEEMHIETGGGAQMARFDTLLLASDGLCDNLFAQEINNIIRVKPLPEVAAKLCSSCYQRMAQIDTSGPSKPDDMTFILIRRTK